MSLDRELREIAGNAGVNHYGIADLTVAHDAVCDQGGDKIAMYPLAVTIGMDLIHPIVDLLPMGLHSDLILYRQQVYDVINTRLDILVSQIASRIQQEGFAAFPVPASTRTDNEKLASFFSHKLAAHCAGLGWIGKSCLLITESAGPRVRWGSVLTNAPLNPTGSPMKERCGPCQKCVDACPVQAFTGESFREEDPRETRFDAGKCDQYFALLHEQGKEAVCGLCLYSCPYGRRASEKVYLP
jgi:epoxyqueuosine reductase